MRFPRPCRAPRRIAGFSLVEATFSIVIVGVMLVAALQTAAAARVLTQRSADRSRAALLAQELMSEILQQPYEDATAGRGSFGPEAGESGPGNRSLFDDVDDYHGWSESPPRDRNGSAIGDAADWRWEVTVWWVSPAAPNLRFLSDTRLKRIEVVVSRSGLVLTRRVSLRSGSGVSLLSLPEGARLSDGG
jgi:MSHA pilin protein MshD